MRSQMEMRYMLLETGGQSHCCYKVAKNLAELCSCPSVFWKVELAHDETAYLVEAMAKQIVEGMAWLLLTAYSKT